MGSSESKTEIHPSESLIPSLHFDLLSGVAPFPSFRSSVVQEETAETQHVTVISQKQKPNVPAEVERSSPPKEKDNLVDPENNDQVEAQKNLSGF